jgi:sensor histidine kinase YesM
MTQIVETSLDRPLPPDVVTGGLGKWSVYANYPTFSWPWLLRRGLIFWPAAALGGLGFAFWHAASMQAWDVFPGLAWRAVAAMLVVVSAGPFLAALARHRRFPAALERVLIVLAIVAGLVIAVAAMHWVNAYHDRLMARYASMSMHALMLLTAGPGQTVATLIHMMPDLFILLIASGGVALAYYFTEGRRLTEHQRRADLAAMRIARDEADLRLAVLQAQVEPHFLFNTLASVRSLVRSDPDRAGATIDALSDYLRATLPRLRDAGVQNATLAEQLDICARYLDLMNVRMDGRLRIVMDIPEALRQTAFPPLILISLVENAVKHGLEPKSGPGVIAIRAQARPNGGLEIAVEDDGVGLSLGPSHGVGLANVRAQLQNRFGAQASLTIANRPEGGARAAIVIEPAAP